tara:strand:+ start:1015 stop:1158 length:144 start_codon:yes stop_codon:yes gene_type:complete
MPLFRVDCNNEEIFFAGLPKKNFLRACKKNIFGVFWISIDFNACVDA